MDFVSIEKFLPYVQPYAEKCPPLVARRAIRDTLIDMTQRMRLSTLRVSLEGKAGQCTYPLNLPYGLRVDQVQSVTLNGGQLKATNRGMLGQLYPSGDWHNEVGVPKYYTGTDSPTHLTIIPAPETDGDKLVCELAVTFTREQNDFPREFFDRHVEVVSCGALSRILALPSQTFTDLAMAAQWANMYSTYMREIKMEVYRDYTRDAGSVKYRNIL